MLTRVMAFIMKNRGGTIAISLALITVALLLSFKSSLLIIIPLLISPTMIASSFQDFLHLQGCDPRWRSPCCSSQAASCRPSRRRRRHRGQRGRDNLPCICLRVQPTGGEGRPPVGLLLQVRRFLERSGNIPLFVFYVWWILCWQYFSCNIRIHLSESYYFFVLRDCFRYAHPD